MNDHELRLYQIREKLDEVREIEDSENILEDFKFNEYKNNNSEITNKNKADIKINIDNHKLMYHIDRVKEWQKNGDCYPIYVEIGIANGCNHRCVFCAIDYFAYEGKILDKDIVISTLKDMADHGVKSVMFAGEGEPLLHKDIVLIVQKAKEFGLDISITTNGILLTKERAEKILPNLTWIRFSFNGGDAQNYTKMHGIKNEKEYEKLIDNIKNAVAIKRANNLDVTLGIQTVVLSENVANIENLARTCVKLGVDNLQLKPYSHHPLSKNNFSITIDEWNEIGNKVKKYENENFQVIVRNNTKNRIDQGIRFPKCFGTPFYALIDAKGNIMTCNLFYTKEDYIFGNLHEKSFSEIWKSERRKRIINRLMDDGTKNCRIGCRLSVVNNYLYDLKQEEIRLEQPIGPVPAHVNFI